MARGLAFPDLDTAYVHVSGRMGGPILFLIVNGSLLLANMGSGMASQLGAARLLYAMGAGWRPAAALLRCRLSPKNRIPRNNVILIGAICLLGALVFSYQLGTELLNYGALLAFMGVNVASMLRGWRHGRWSQWFPMLLSSAASLPACCSGSALVLWQRSRVPAGRSWEFCSSSRGGARPCCLPKLRRRTD